MKKIGDYEIVREIGRGGMGVVILAKAPDGTEVALKLLQNLTKESLLQRFQREERLQGLLSAKEGFVPLLASGESPEGPYMVMPYLKGGTLRDRLQKGMFDLDHALVLVHALAQALGKAHEAGVVHRDMKPENVLFDEAGRPFVSDLGLAKHFRRDLPGGSKSINVTKTGQSLGTTGYMAIEQMRDAVNVGPAADVFALGAMLYECLIGRCPPYLGRQPLTAIRPDLPEWVSKAIETALARDPRNRYPDGLAFARALQQAATKLDMAAFQQAKTGETVTAAHLAETETRLRPPALDGFVDELPGDAPERPSSATAPGSEVKFASSVPDSEAPAAAVAPPPAGTHVETKADTKVETRLESKVETKAESTVQTAVETVEMKAETTVATRTSAPAAPPVEPTVEVPPPAPAPDRTWLWVVLLVAVGVIAGVLADRLLR